jgi:hypothetical protein
MDAQSAIPESHDSGAPPTLLARKSFGGKGVTQKVGLPANWDKLVAKYRDLVPTYAAY